ncbi:MAG: tetratricopeptide repeat protein [Candidatus Glassbacteria bacterium]|nr:tetratricopeptide repeat protein [Candidatus Glassbacteria bacterium]
MRRILITLMIPVIWFLTVASTPVVTGAKVRIKAKKFKEAAEVLEENKAQYPDDPELYYYLARAYAGIAQWAKAGENYSLALLKNPDKDLKKDIEKYRNYHWASFVKDATALLQQKRYSETISKYRLANSINPDRKESHANLGVALLEQAQLCQSAEPPQPDSAKILYQEAIENLKAAIELDPEDHSFVKNLGHAYLISGNEDEAIRIYEEFLDESPDDFDVQRRLVSIYMNRSDFENSARIYSQWLNDAGLEIGTDISMADLYNAGMCYYQLYLKLDKSEDEATKQQAHDYLVQAAECFSRVYEDTPTDCESGVQLYYIYITLDRWDQVITTIETMIDNNCPRDHATLQNLGVAYMKQGDKTKAIEIWKEAEELKAKTEGSN